MIVIVGAGPAGLAMAYELQRRGRAYQVLERHSIGHAWRNHYDRLHLHTLKQVSHLPGLTMPADYPSFPAAQQFQAYLAQYAQHFRLNIQTGVEVCRADWQAGAWRLQTSSGLMQAQTLVAATGIWSKPVSPRLPGADTFGGPILHASDYRNAAPFKGRRVLVVGAGNSGAEIAVEVSQVAAASAIAIRSGVTFVPHPGSATAVRLAAWLLRRLPPALGERFLQAVRRDFSSIGLQPPHEPLREAYPVVGYALPDAVAAGRVRVHPALVGFAAGMVHFADGSRFAYDTVILATGYNPALDFVAHELEFDLAGRPRVDHRWRATRNPHLVCIGYHYPATEGWLQAIGRVVAQAAV